MDIKHTEQQALAGDISCQQVLHDYHTERGNKEDARFWKHANTLAIDTETTGPDFHHGSRPFYVSSCNGLGTGKSWEWDVDLYTRTPYIPSKEVRLLQKWIDSHGRLVFHNPKFDIKALQSIGIKFPAWKHIEDTLVASHCLGSATPHGLKQLAMTHLSVGDYDESALQEAVNNARRTARSLDSDIRLANPEDPHFPALKSLSGKGWWALDMWLPRAVARHYLEELREAEEFTPEHPWWTICSEYANTDASRTMALWVLFEEELHKQDLWDQYSLRKRMLEITYNMEVRGTTISRTSTFTSIGKHRDNARIGWQDCTSLVDIENLNSGPQLQKALYEDLGVKPTKITKTGYSTAQDVLAGYLQTLDPDSYAAQFIRSLFQYRKCSKAVDYLESYLKYAVGHGEYLTLHPRFNVTGTHTTRFSCQFPNLQNIGKGGILTVDGVPILDIKFTLRDIFCPGPRRVWYSHDFSNIELRIFAYACGDKGLIKAFEEGKSAHLIVCQQLYPKEFAECERKGEDFAAKYKATYYQWVKNGNFSLIYGASPTKANATYRVPNAYTRIRKGMPLIDKFMQSKFEEARRYGYVTTLGGYQLQVPGDKPHVAVNYFVQGSAGWAMCLALDRCDEYLQQVTDHHMIMSIHDEIVFDFPVRKDNTVKARRCKELMESVEDVMGFPCPVDADIITTSWDKGEALV